MMRPKPPFCFFVATAVLGFSPCGLLFSWLTLLVDEHCSLCRLL